VPALVALEQTMDASTSSQRASFEQCRSAPGSGRGLGCNPVL